MKAVLLRGFPGVGKSTFAKANYPNATIISADNFYTRNFDKHPNKLHSWMSREDQLKSLYREQFTYEESRTTAKAWALGILVMTIGKHYEATNWGLDDQDIIVIDNCHINYNTMVDYIRVLEYFGVEWTTKIVQSDFDLWDKWRADGCKVDSVVCDEMCDALSKRNSHGVTPTIIKSMAGGWLEDPFGGRIGNFEHYVP